MDDAITALTSTIEGLRADVRAAAKDTRELVSTQTRVVRELVALVGDFRDELAELRRARDRHDRILQRVDALETVTGVRRPNGK